MRVVHYLLALLLLIAVNISYARIPNHEEPSTFLGPTLRLTYGGWFNNTAAYSLLGELGGSNFRVNATAGYKISELQRFKVSGEWLWQNINYGFLAGTTKEWMNQGAIGADYQIDFGHYYDVTFDLSAYASHAASKNLNTLVRSYISNGILNTFTNFRHIAGSNAAGISPGIDFVFWEGGNAGIDLNYDNVHYDTRYNNRNEQAVGFGGTAHIDQQIGDNVVLGISAAVRRPFNLYQVNLNFDNLYWYGRWGVGLFGYYTAGKENLPSTYNAGLSVNYFMDRILCVTPTAQNFKGEVNYKDELPIMATPIDQGFLNWVNDPAVYMPQVLAIADQAISQCPAGVGPVAIGTVPDQLIINGGPGVPLALAPFFTGTGLTYAATVTPALAPGDIITVDPVTGVLTTFYGSDELFIVYNVTVTASNSCGIASQTFTVTMASTE